MPFSGTIYTPPTGAENATPGAIIQSATWNAIHTDIAAALTEVMSQLIAQSTNRNILCANGSFEVWQRGAGASASIAVGASTTAYTSDRWYLSTGANEASVVSAQTGLSNNSLKCVRIQKNAAQTGTAQTFFGYPLDTSDIARLRGKEVTLSFLIRSGANWSPTNGAINVALQTGTGAVTKFINGYTGAIVVLNNTTNLGVSSAITAISVQSTIVVPTNTTQAEIIFSWTPVGTAGASDYVEIDDVQLECNLSSDEWTPTIFDRIVFEQELALCKRYYNKSFPYSVAPAQNAGYIGALMAPIQVASARCAIFWQYPVEMRATASVITYCPGAASINWMNASVSVSVSVILETSTASPKSIYINSTVSAPAVAIAMYIHADADAGI